MPKLSTNDYLRLAATFHSLHVITARGIHVSPLNDPKRAAAAGPDALPRNQEGIQSLEAKVERERRRRSRWGWAERVHGAIPRRCVTLRR